MIVITGAKGQLGYDFQKIFTTLGIPFIATDFDQLDITDKNAIDDFFFSLKAKNIIVSHIINCAAYNNVDQAEKERELCYALNATAPKQLALIAKKYEAQFVTYSTDFVFDGEKGDSYKEEDDPSPVSYYGLSKADGEKAVLDCYDKSLIIRTSWVFGVANKNFNTQVMGWAKEKETLSIVDDQYSAPTYSYDLAYYSHLLFSKKKQGIYHLTNDGVASKYDQAAYLLKKINWKGTLTRAKSSDFNLLAKRPVFSKLNTTKIKATLNETIPTWEDGIDRYLKELNNHN